MSKRSRSIQYQIKLPDTNWMEELQCGHLQRWPTSTPPMKSAATETDTYAKCVQSVLQWRRDPEKAQLEHRVMALEEKVASQESILGKLTGIEPIISEEEIDPLQKWLDEHPSDRMKLNGKHFAFKEGVGVVAVGDSVNEVYEEVKKGNLLKEVEFGRLLVPMV